MASAKMMNVSEKNKIDSGFYYGTLFMDCPEEIAITIRENLSNLFGHVELAHIEGDAFTFAVSA